MKVWKTIPARGAVLALLLLAIPVALVGCGDGLGPTGTVSGNVTYNGEPLAPEHAVALMNLETGYACQGYTDAEGNYTLDSWNDGELPIGTYSVQISPPLGAVIESATGGEGEDEFVDRQVGEVTYPRRYTAYGASETSFEVKEGENTFDLDMED